MKRNWDFFLQNHSALNVPLKINSLIHNYKQNYYFRLEMLDWKRWNLKVVFPKSNNFLNIKKNNNWTVFRGSRRITLDTHESMFWCNWKIGTIYVSVQSIEKIFLTFQNIFFKVYLIEQFLLFVDIMKNFFHGCPRIIYRRDFKL